MKKSFSTILLMAALVVASAASAQDLTRYSDEGLRKELSAIADSEKAVLVPMRDGIGLSTNIWRPKGATGKLPTVLWKTPYNEHKVRGGTARYAIEAVRRGYAFIVQNERGRYFRSEEHTSELQSLMRISYAVFCLKKKKISNNIHLNLT